MSNQLYTKKSNVQILVMVLKSLEKNYTHTNVKIFQTSRSVLGTVNYAATHDNGITSRRASSNPNCSISHIAPNQWCLEKQWKVSFVLGSPPLRDPGEIPGSSLCPGPAPAIVTILRVDHQMEALFLYLPLSLVVTLPFK